MHRERITSDPHKKLISLYRFKMIRRGFTSVETDGSINERKKVGRRSFTKSNGSFNLKWHWRLGCVWLRIRKLLYESRDLKSNTDLLALFF